MTVRILTQAPESDLADALEQFERQFIYPLGPGQSFRISHGRDYPRFFRAIAGDASASFVAMGGNGEVRGTLGAAIRPLMFPSGECRLAVYLGDLKTAAGTGRGWTLMRLTAEATAWSIAHGAVVAYGVVMEGTSHSPSQYTGRFGMHAFRAVERLCILRIPVESAGGSADDSLESDSSSVDDCFRALGSGAFAPLGGAPELRSASSPRCLMAPDRSACGVIEDTRLAKRLIRDDDEEMLTAHLSKFAYRNPSAGARLVQQALAHCANRALAPAMFVAIPSSDLNAFRTLLGNIAGIVEAPAAIYGTGFNGIAAKWNVSASEI